MITFFQDFDPFFTTKALGKGIEQDLSICFGIVNEHNSRIFAISGPGKGTIRAVEMTVVSRDKDNEEPAISGKVQEVRRE